MCDVEARSFSGPSSNRETLTEQVEKALATAITCGQVAPGNLLTVPTLASQFGVSTTPVREAALILVQRGFLESVPNRGFRVTQVSERGFAETVELQQLLEGPPMQIVAQTFPAGDRSRFDALTEQMRVARDTQDLAAYNNADNKFHLGLLEYADNEALIEIVRRIREQTRTTGTCAGLDRNITDRTLHEHRSLLDLILRGDGAAAERLMHRHLGRWATGQVVCERTRKADH